MSEQTTEAPSAARATAIARPLPELEPVTTATLSSSLLAMSVPRFGVGWAGVNPSGPADHPGQPGAPGAEVARKRSAGEVLDEPVAGGRAGDVEAIDVGVEVPAGQELLLLRLARLLVRADRQLGRGEHVVLCRQHQQRSRADVGHVADRLVLGEHLHA